MNASDEHADLRTGARELLESHWLDAGYAMPNRQTYPWQWLWDSCFHALVWAALGDRDRATTEVERLFTYQTPRGFVPHMNYFDAIDEAIDAWGQPHHSKITQPPMYGHAIAELVAADMAPPAATVEAGERGLHFLLDERRRTAGGLVELCHPWESGCDDSARWDGALDEPWDRERWREHKWKLVATLEFDGELGSVANPNFAVGSIGFNALIAFNARELAKITGSAALSAAADELAQAIEARWDPELRTWVDDGDFAAGSGRVRTLDAHFALLVVAEPSQLRSGFDDLIDPAAFGAHYGPAGIHRDEPTRDPITYWRGPAWPQMSYLMWLAASRAGERAIAGSIAASLRRGAIASGWAEFWHPDTGLGCGAIPQSWTTLAAICS